MQNAGNEVFSEDIDVVTNVKKAHALVQEARTLQLTEIANSIRKRLRDERDVVMAITGEEGEGKSVLEVQLARLICGNDIPFSLANNIIFDPDTKVVGKKIYDLPPFSPIGVDEAVKVAYKGNFMLGSQKFLKQLFSICRGQYKCVILCIPNFRDLDLFFRQHRVSRWLFVVKRGMGISLIKRRNPFDNDPWRVKANFEIVENALRNNPDPPPSTVAAAMQQTRNFQSIFYFDNLEPEWLAEYKRLKEEISPDFASLTMNKPSIREAKMREAVKLLIEQQFRENPHITFMELEKKTGLSVGFLHKLIHEEGLKNAGMLRLKANRDILLNKEPA